MVMAGDLVMEAAAVQGLGLGAGTGLGTGTGLVAESEPGLRDGDGGIDEFAPSSSTPVVRMLTEKEVDSLTFDQRKALFRGTPPPPPSVYP